MSKYKDEFDIEEFKLFRKFNNSEERKNRHVDSYMIENSEKKDKLEEKIKYNRDALIKDTLIQVERMEDYFSDLDIEGDIK